MKILMVPSWYPPNGGRFFRNQAEALAKKGYSVDVLILEEKGISSKVNTKITSVKSLLINEYRETFFRIPKLNSINTKLFIRKFQSVLQKYLKENKPDVILVQSVVWAGVVVSEIALSNNIPYVIFEQRSLFIEKEFPFGAGLKLKVKNAFEKASGILAVSNGMKNKLKKFTSNKIMVIPNMVDSDFFQKKNNSTKNNNKITFLAVGNLIEVKGFDILIEAFSLLKKDFKLQLKIVGSGNALHELQQLVIDKKLEDRIHFLGYKTKEELVKEYIKADIYVSSSRKETFGVTIIEAMSCGLPIVATECSGPLDIVNERNGYLAKINNVQSLYEIMKRMIEKHTSFDGEIIRQEVLTKYSEEVVVALLIRELKKY